jgi:hypothetical protein
MVGAVPKYSSHALGDRGDRSTIATGFRDRMRLASARTVAICLVLPLSLTLAQCAKAPDPGALAANAAVTGDSFEDRFPAPQFRDRFPSSDESFRPFELAPKQAAAPETAPYQVASLEPQVPPAQRPAERDELTTLVSMKSSAFPYFGNNPASDEPFLNITKGDRRGHRSFGGQVFWQDETYNDNRVLMHIPENFNIKKPGVIVVFFHGNGATLERDVRDRQLLPQQITDSGVNAVLLAPQLAVDAADSSAGKFWQAGGFKRFMAESADHLGRLYGDGAAAKAFANMPIVIVGYSGGFLPTAYSLDVGGIANRVRGVVLLDAVYGQLDKFASWIENNPASFFVSSYTHYTARHDHELMQMLKDKGIALSETMDAPLRPGRVVFIETGEGITHRNYVTQAWTQDPVKDVLVKMAAGQSATRVAASNASAANR